MDDNLCPNCETYGLVDHQDRIECKNCRYSIPRLDEKPLSFRKIGILLRLPLRFPLIPFYALQILLFLISIMLICIYIYF